ncbi:hypothetical protein, partial [Mesorhizobium sp.]|uniref:hypothetical protein n=1 Tax=Mesorhizobium sp. TaxID=1871066 RepID=UPI0025E2A9CA
PVRLSIIFVPLDDPERFFEPSFPSGENAASASCGTVPRRLTCHVDGSETIFNVGDDGCQG